MPLGISTFLKPEIENRSKYLPQVLSTKTIPLQFLLRSDADPALKHLQKSNLRDLKIRLYVPKNYGVFGFWNCEEEDDLVWWFLQWYCRQGLRFRGCEN